MAAKQPKLSIGMPVYNGAAYLAAALDSLLGQSFGDFELIISDNASTDDTEAICRDYAARESRIRYDRLQQNCGAVGNFNRAFRLSQSEYFKWAACDDVCAPTYLQRCVEVLDSDGSVAWCHARSTHIDSQGQLFSDNHLADVSYIDRSAASPQARFHAVLMGRGGCLDSYGVMRSNVIRQTPLYLPYFGAEKVFIADLSLRGRYEEVPEVLFFPRIHDRAAGAMETASQQQEYIDPRRAGRFQFTRLRLLRGYFGAICRADLQPVERVACLSVLARYLLQVGKWKSVAAKLINGTGLAGTQRQTLQALGSKVTDAGS